MGRGVTALGMQLAAFVEIVVRKPCVCCVFVFSLSGRARLVFQSSKRPGRKRGGLRGVVLSHAPILFIFLNRDQSYDDSPPVSNVR